MAEYRRLRRNAKAKLNRLRNKYNVDLQSEIPVPDSIDEFNTREQFNQWKELIGDFTSRRYTRWQFRENRFGVVQRVSDINRLQYASGRVQRQADRVIAELDKRIDDTDDPLLKERMFNRRNDSISRPATFNFQDVKSDFHFNRRLEQMEKRAEENYYDKRMKQMRDNYADIIERDLGRKSRASEMIRNLDPLDFYEIYMSNRELFDFVFWDSDRDGVDDNPNETREVDTIELLEREARRRQGDDMWGFFLNS